MTVIKIATGVAIGILLAIGIVVLVIAALAPPKPEPTAVLTVTTVPLGALVNLDGRDIGSSPVQLKVPVGEHRIVLQLDGYGPHSQMLNVPREGMPYLQPLTALPTASDVPLASGQH